MMKQLIRNISVPSWPTCALLAVNATALWACATCWWQGSAAPTLLATDARRIALPTPLEEPIPAARDLTPIQNAAVFHESRRFYVAPQVPVELPHPNYRFAASWSQPGRPATALLIQNPSGTRLKVQPGANVEGWRVDSIDARGVLLRHAEQQLEIGARQSMPVPGIQTIPAAALQSRAPITTTMSPRQQRLPPG